MAIFLSYLNSILLIAFKFLFVVGFCFHACVPELFGTTEKCRMRYAKPARHFLGFFGLGKTREIAWCLVMIPLSWKVINSSHMAGPPLPAQYSDKEKNKKWIAAHHAATLQAKKPLLVRCLRYTAGNISPNCCRAAGKQSPIDRRVIFRSVAPQFTNKHCRSVAKIRCLGAQSWVVISFVYSRCSFSFVMRFSWPLSFAART